MALSRKHYVAIAHAIKQSNTSNTRNNINKVVLINELCNIFYNDNSLFNRDRFINACNDE